MDDGTGDPILVISAKWQTRALLAAELGERTGREVVPASDVSGALGMIRLAGLDPALMVVDAGWGMGPEDVERLREAKREVPLVLVASALRRDAFDPLGECCAAYLVRPVRMGAIARAVVEVLGGRGTNT